jgi:5-methylcytosine-specific restriction endonuclease McrBC GTP-binding regulatory subunit McrB
MHTIVESTTVNYTQRQTPFIFNKTTDKKWELHENELSEQVPELYDTLASVNNFKPGSDKEIKHYVFTTFHQSFSYEDFIEGIKPVMEDGHDNVTYRIENGIFKELCLRAQNDPTNRYAIFIDEINRGNISQIFGELITLIEADKRIGASNEIKVKLPYSKKEFGVPSNIDIYGTMNTADRSVEALDTALRRRFSFVEMMPESQVIAAKSFKDFDRVNTMLTINKRIELLLDRNHTLGHAYFMKNDFRSSFENEIIPLLQEYFYNDYGKIGLVLGKGFVRVKELTLNNTSSIFADFETKNEVDIARSYELIPFHAVDFKQAIETLLA